jgi:hypothetical protein
MKLRAASEVELQDVHRVADQHLRTAGDLVNNNIVV